jgi:hypothetical protein
MKLKCDAKSCVQLFLCVGCAAPAEGFIFNLIAEMEEKFRVCIFGASGFVGRRIVREILHRHPDAQILTLSRSNKFQETSNVLWYGGSAVFLRPTVRLTNDSTLQALCRLIEGSLD